MVATRLTNPAGPPVMHRCKLAGQVLTAVQTASGSLHHPTCRKALPQQPQTSKLHHAHTSISVLNLQHNWRQPHTCCMAASNSANTVLCVNGLPGCAAQSARQAAPVPDDALMPLKKRRDSSSAACRSSCAAACASAACRKTAEAAATACKSAA
jgi:hypothetical protein